MSLVEQARARLEETRTRIKTQGNLLSGSILGQGEVSPIKAFREKGVLSVLEEKFPKVKEIRGGGGQGVIGVLGERFPKVKEMREKGILARITGSVSTQAISTLPSSVSTQAIERGTSSVISEVPLKRETRNISIDMN